MNEQHRKEYEGLGFKIVDDLEAGVTYPPQAERVVLRAQYEQALEQASRARQSVVALTERVQAAESQLEAARATILHGSEIAQALLARAEIAEAKLRELECLSRDADTERADQAEARAEAEKARADVNALRLIEAQARADELDRINRQHSDELHAASAALQAQIQRAAELEGENAMLIAFKTGQDSWSGALQDKIRRIETERKAAQARAAELGRNYRTIIAELERELAETKEKLERPLTEALLTQARDERNAAQAQVTQLREALSLYADESNWSSSASEILEPDDEFGQPLPANRVEVELGEQRVFELAGSGFKYAKEALGAAPAASARAEKSENSLATSQLICGKEMCKPFSELQSRAAELDRILEFETKAYRAALTDKLKLERELSLLSQRENVDAERAKGERDAAQAQAEKLREELMKLRKIKRYKKGGGQ